MKKKIIIYGSIIGALLLLYIFNRVTTKGTIVNQLAEVKQGDFEISITVAGELIAEKSIDIKGPELARGRDIRSSMIKIQDLIPEGTIVKEGDYIATLDRTDLNNNLKDYQDQLEGMENDLKMKILDSAVVLNDYRDMILNQRYQVSEAEMTLKNSKYESPNIIREAEINYDQAQRVLRQRQRGYTRRVAQLRTDIYNEKFWISRVTKRVNDLVEVLSECTITAPSSGMVIYKREWKGNKRKVGSNINAMDRVVATLPDLTSMLSKVYINEIEISKIQVGQMVNLTIDAFPKKAFKGTVSFVANIGDKLPNTDDKVFEVQIKVDGTDPALRPSMTTGNKIMIKTFKNVVYIPGECVQTGLDSIPFVYTKGGSKQVLLLGEANDKNIIVEKGLEPGTMIYLANPEHPENFKLQGEEIIPLIKARIKAKKLKNAVYRNKPQGVL